ncbi:hypothetical protein C8Q77DRAFT_1143595 [Trametes polyzona]|nr:hypothetical protein C8Q77DRAFT_1143595 [Trametes polyzona]
MHSALLIDEVLQLIFDHCVALPDADPRWTLCQLARCCKAWKDPALDRLWSRIDGATPLLNLLKSSDDKILRSFHECAARVKEISHHACIPPMPTGEPTPILPRLQAVTLSFHGCTVLTPWVLSSHLKRISVNIGFARYPPMVTDRCNAVAGYLTQAQSCAPGLESLHIRGRMTDSLNSAVASLTQLRSLSIYSNRFLTCDTLAEIATFPNLRSLAVHASSVRHSDFADALAPLYKPCFPALEELEIRASGSLLAVLVEHLPAGVLTKLNAEVDRSPHGPSYLKGMLEELVQKTSASLTELSVEDLTEHEDLESARSLASPEWYPLSLLSPLAALKGLKRFSLVSALPPAITDADLESMSKWWPLLTHLNLGTIESDYLPADWPVHMTAAALPTVAKHFPRLESLALPILPIDFVAETGKPATPETPAPQQATLRTLTIGDLPDAAGCIPTLVQTILALFPSLTTLECPTHEVTERFAAVRLC